VRTLVLASTSPYRRKLLRQLGLPFLVAAPRFSEEIEQSVAPELLVKHLATEKAKSLVELYPDALIIGADQVFVDQRGRLIGKPGNADEAIRQLQGMSGCTHTFYTGLCVVDSRSQKLVSDFETFNVTLRNLSVAEIEAYVQRENPLDCSGSFKIEGLGIALMQEMSGRDYNTLIGMPLIKLIDILEQFEIQPLQSALS
jgi:septum formation protein